MMAAGQLVVVGVALAVMGVYAPANLVQPEGVSALADGRVMP